MSKHIRNQIAIFCTIVIFILTFIAAILGITDKTLNTNLNVAVSKEIGSFVPNSADGSIEFENNNFFKKYTIICNSEIDTPKYSEDKYAVHVSFDKNLISKVDIKSNSNIVHKDVIYQNEKNEINFSFTKSYDNVNYVYVDDRDKKKVVILISKKEKPYDHTVVLDAGHGGNDKGTSYGNIYEKNLTLKIVKYMINGLRYNGCNVLLVRDKDKWVDYKKERAAVANNANADVFVSVHINSNVESQYNGVDTYYWNPNTDDKARSVELAKDIQTEILKSDNWKDMKTAKNNLAVLTHTKMPAVLVECGFLSNPSDRNKLMKDKTLQNFATNISNGILVFLDEKHGQ